MCLKRGCVVFVGFRDIDSQGCSLCQSLCFYLLDLQFLIEGYYLSPTVELILSVFALCISRLRC